jgi:hypothetical protein
VAESTANTGSASERSATKRTEASHESLLKIAGNRCATYRTKRAHPDRWDTEGHTETTKDRRQELAEPARFGEASVRVDGQ